MSGQVVARTAQKAVLVHQMLDAPLFHKALGHIACRSRGAACFVGGGAEIAFVAFTPGTCIAFVGRDQIGCTVCGLVGGDGVRLEHAVDVGGPGDVDDRALAVTVGEVQLVAGRAMILVAQSHHIGHGGAGDVHDGQRIVFLQRHPGRLAVRGHGNVFGLQVVGHGGRSQAVCGRAEDAHALGQQLRLLAVEGLEVGSARHGLGGRAHIDHADRAFGVDLVVIAGLALVGDQNGLAVGGEGQHIGQGAHGHFGDHAELVGVIDDDHALVRLDRCLHGCSHQAAMHGHAVDGGPRTQRELCGIQAGQHARCGGVAHVQHVERTLLGVDHKAALGDGIESRNFGGALQKNARLIAADFLQRERGGRLLGLGCRRRDFRNRSRRWCGVVRVVVTATTGGQGSGCDQGNQKRLAQGLCRCH